MLRNHTIAASACTPSRTAIYTGQYGTRTGATQTDGLFKNGDSENFPWLAADGIPTLGSWMRAAGYSTHYFGKWHVSNPPDHSLQRYGFDDWEESFPEPHGAQANNLGSYRDPEFASGAANFLRRKGLAANYNYAYASMVAQDPTSTGPVVADIPPWFAVASFANPHDIAAYPGVIAQALPDPDAKTGTQSVFGPLTVPTTGEVTPPPTAGTARIPLNPKGFPQDCASPSPTQGESLADKPTCQHEAAYKVGLGLAAKGGFNIAAGLAGAAPGSGSDPSGPDPSGDDSMAAAVALSLRSCIPFQLAGDPGPDQNCLQFLQLYAWLHAAVDVQINAVLQALEESGQADNTIVILLADHGEYGAAHGMMLEKWHAAYQEAVHVPFVVKFPGGDTGSAQPGTLGPEPAQIDALTSHIDVVPTVLGLAGVSATEMKQIAQQLAQTRPVPPLPGVDLSGLIANAANGNGSQEPIIEHDGEVREGVLFITDDEITAPLPPARTATEQRSYQEFAVYEKVVESVIHGIGGKGPVALTPGSVKQPNHIRAVRTLDHKLARYFDPSGREAQEWEMYDLNADPNEAVNLVEVGTTPPTARPDLPDSAKVQAAADRLARLLEKLERRDL